MPVSYFRRGEKLAFAVRFTAAEVEAVEGAAAERKRREVAHRIRIVRDGDEPRMTEDDDAATE